MRLFMNLKLILPPSSLLLATLSCHQLFLQLDVLSSHSLLHCLLQPVHLSLHDSLYPILCLVLSAYLLPIDMFLLILLFLRVSLTLPSRGPL